MMRRFSLVLLTGLLMTHLAAQELLQQRISLSMSDTPLEEALFILMDDYGIPLSFNNDILPPKQMTAVLQDRPLEAILDYVLRNTGLSFRRVGRQIVLFELDYDTPPLESPSYTLSGYVQDADTGEPLIYAGVFDEQSKKGTMTNEFGFFSLTLPAGKVDLLCSYIGYEPEGREIELKADRRLHLGLRTALVLEEVLVVAEDPLRDRSALGGRTDEINLSEVAAFPQLGGEPDAVRLTHFLPGVQTGTDGIGGIFVRGGDAGHNLVLLDGVPVYNLFHGAGLFSIFNADALKSVRLMKGAFPARHGGRLASVLDVRTRDGNRQEFQGTAGIGLLSARATVEGPLIKNKSSFIISARRSFLDWYLRPASQQLKAKQGENGAVDYNFYDFSAKFNIEASPRDKLFLSLYSGRDNFLNYGEARQAFRLGEDREEQQLLNYNSHYREKLFWGNQVASLRWNHVFGPKLFANTTLTYSRLGVDIEQSARDSILQQAPLRLISKSLEYSNYHSSIEDVGLRMDLEYIPSTLHYLRFGAQVTHHDFQPGIVQYDEKTEEVLHESPVMVTPEHSMEYAAYVEDDMVVADQLRMNVGVRATLLTVVDKSYFSVEPRFALTWNFHPRMRLNASSAVNSQFLHLLSSSNLGLPIDLWVPSTADIAPQRSQQWALGLDRRIGEAYLLSIEAYFNRMDNLVTYQEGAYFLNNWRRSVTAGSGKAYGVEAMLRKKSGRTTGWLAYTLSWARRQFDEINDGEWYPFKYDRRHNLQLIGRHAFNDWLSATADWTFGTGLAFSLPLFAFETPGQGGDPVLSYDGKNNFRMPYYHRLDLGVRMTFDSKNLQHALNLGLYNAYNRDNLLYYDIRRQAVQRDGELIRRFQPERVNMMPLLPYFNYSVKF